MIPYVELPSVDAALHQILIAAYRKWGADSSRTSPQVHVHSSTPYPNVQHLTTTSNSMDFLSKWECSF